MTPAQPATWYNADRVAAPGSVILNAWKAEREAARAGASPAAVRNATTYASSCGTKGSELYLSLIHIFKFSLAQVLVFFILWDFAGRNRHRT